MLSPWLNAPPFPAVKDSLLSIDEDVQTEEVSLASVKLKEAMRAFDGDRTSARRSEQQIKHTYLY